MLPQRAIDRLIEVNEQWANDMQRLAYRQSKLSLLFIDLLEEVPEGIRSKYLLRYRAIDNEYRSMYHGNKVTQSDNEQGVEQSKPTQSPATFTGGPMS